MLFQKYLALKKESDKNNDHIVICNSIDHYLAEMNSNRDLLALNIGSSRLTIDKICEGKFSPSLYLSLLICAYLDKPVEDVFSLYLSSDFK